MIASVMKYLRILGLGGLLSAVRAKVTNATVLYEVDRRDCQHPFRLRIPSSDVLAYNQIFINREYDFVARTPPEVIVDAGANIGLASIYLANRYPDAQIISIEPEQGNFDLLKENVAPYPHVTPVHAALWHRIERINLIDPGWGNWGFVTGTGQPSDGLPGDTRHTVMGMTIDKIMKDHGLTKIDILKVDIEGAEKEVFSDTSSWIDKVASIIIELHDRGKVGCNRSFYSGSAGFDSEWRQGEHVCVSRGDYLGKRSA